MYTQARRARSPLLVLLLPLLSPRRWCMTAWRMALPVKSPCSKLPARKPRSFPNSNTHSNDEYIKVRTPPSPNISNYFPPLALILKQQNDSLVSSFFFVPPSLSPPPCVTNMQLKIDYLPTFQWKWVSTYLLRPVPTPFFQLIYMTHICVLPSVLAYYGVTYYPRELSNSKACILKRSLVVFIAAVVHS